MNLLNVINEAGKIREEYNKYIAIGFPLEIESYIEFIARYTEFTINLNQIREDAPWKSHNFRGKIHRFDETKTANIYIPRQKSRPNEIHGVTHCEQRFITIKEACHLIIDADDSYATNATTLIENIVYDNVQGKIDRLPEENQSEIYAFVAAHELLFPWENREHYREKINNREISHHAIADIFKIPERQVFWILSDNAHPALAEAHRDLRKLKGTK